MLRVPFRFLEGCLIAAHGIQSQHVFIYIRGEYEQEFEILRDSLEAMRTADLLGGVTVVLHRGPARTSAARRPRSSSRSKASAASRGRSRRSRRSRASTPRRPR